MLSGIEPAEAKSSTAIAPELGAFVDVAKPAPQGQATNAGEGHGPAEAAPRTDNRH